MKKFYYIIILIILLGGGFALWKFVFNKSISPPPADLGLRFPEGLGELKIYQPQANEDFTFSYPNKLHIIEQPLEGIEGGKRLLAESNEPGQGFEVIILPFDEKGTLTEGRIRADVPDIVMKNVKNIALSGNIPALSFDSADEGIGETHEVWFVNNGYLYQARTYPDFGEVMEQILQTWKFK
jgi:hypothetical protein